jgi:hypothetical protein
VNTRPMDAIKIFNQSLETGLIVFDNDDGKTSV